MLHIIHDNADWLVKLKSELDNSKIKYKEWDLNNNLSCISQIDINKAPPEGIYYNRVSASSHTRKARYSLEYCKVLLAWLSKWGRTIINSSNTLELEASKFIQYIELTRHNINVPTSYFGTNKKEIYDIAKTQFLDKKLSCIIKDNRGGSGISVKLIHTIDELTNYLLDNNYIEPIDGLSVIQEYIVSSDNYITRMEFIDKEFVYAVRVDTSKGFHLCPADKCSINTISKFKIEKNFKQGNKIDLIEKCKNLIKNYKIDVCGMEFITDSKGKMYIYDINCNTNYNTSAEKVYGDSGLATRLLIDYFKRLK